MPRHRSEASSHVIKCRFVVSAVTYPHFIVPTIAAAFKGALHQSRNERDGHWVLGRTLPDLKLSLLLKRHNCIELSYLDPRIVRQVRPLPGVSRTCAVMINSLENPVHMNLLEELRKRPVRLRLKRARPAAKLPPPVLACRSRQPYEELWSDR